MKDVKVVIAEDDPQIAEIQRRFIDRIDGFELVGIAHGLKEAEDLLDVLKPELLLLDIQFPSGSGLELLRKLRSQNSSTDVILITAAKEVNTLKEALHGGVFYYILKPLVFERLQEALKNYLKHIEKLRAMESLAQSDVDTVLPQRTVNESGSIPVKNAMESIRLPKGIDSLTLDRIREVVIKKGNPLSAEEVGILIGASRTTARRYLEYLVSNGEVQAEAAYGTVGRPERRYRVLGS